MRASITVEFDMPQHASLLDVAKSVAEQLNDAAGHYARITNTGTVSVTRAGLLKP